ncbi:hydrolase [Salirhabdus salicampi]|uniref:hydrolase n=1 Tax=Salirhabdus salicampi TaxID=476102 RepID=UPI0020C29C65|nr:hydrolase [Salirhabdus salicampi]MCP8617797.1 hydrolase [Salirhabdus salicampi]
MEKEKFYVDIGSMEISRLKAGDNNDYVIYATPEEVIKLRDLFDNMYSADGDAFIRAHIPIKQYHHDESNDNYDEAMIQIFRMLYELGDEQTRNHIKSMEILKNI